MRVNFYKKASLREQIQLDIIFMYKLNIIPFAVFVSEWIIFPDVLIHPEDN
mgnify:FL=1